MITKAVWAYRSLVFDPKAVQVLKDLFAMEVISVMKDDSPSADVKEDGSVTLGMSPESQKMHRFAVSHWSRFFEYPWAWIEGDLSPEHEILDAGGGLAPFQLLAASRCRAVVNLDADINIIELAKRTTVFRLAKSLSIRQGDIRNIPYEDGRFDRVFCISVLEHLDRPNEALSELLRVLKPGGHLIFTVDVTEGGDGFSENAVKVLLAQFGIKIPEKPPDTVRVRSSDKTPEMFVLCVKITK